MLQLEMEENFVIATGETFTFEDFVAYNFKVLGLNWKDYVVQNQALFRPTDILISCSDASKAKEKLGRTTNIKAYVVVERILECHDY